MNLRALALPLLIAGCAAPAGLRDPGSAQTAQPARAEITGPDADFRAERPGLRRIGYRNCDGFSMQMLVPPDPGAGDPRAQRVWWEIKVYQPGRHASYRIRLPEDFDSPAWRSERRVGGTWQALPRPQAAHPRRDPVWVSLASDRVGASLPISHSVSDVTGLGADTLRPGTYRIQTAPFTVIVPGGQSCSMQPFWVFDIR